MIYLAKLTLAILVLAGISACRDKTKHHPAIVIHQGSANIQKAVPTVTVVNDTLIQMQFTAGDTGIIAAAQAYLKDEITISCQIANATADSIHARLLPNDESSTIQFTHLYTPGGKKEGPFGQEIHYATKEEGTYILTIGAKPIGNEKGLERFKIKVWVK